MRATLEQATALLLQGQIVAVPTETVYGLAASLTHPEAVAKIYSLKGRPANNPLIVHLSSGKGISAFVREFPPDFLKLTSSFWPGPLTIILKIIPGSIPEKINAGLPTAAFRVPHHNITQTLLKRTGPLVMPSANLSGKPSATRPEHVEEDFGLDFPVLNGGTCIRGIESTILFWHESGWEIVRLGALAPEAFVPILGYCPKIAQIDQQNDAALLCPGQFYRHYAPKAKLKLVREIPPNSTGFVLGYKDREYPAGCRVFSLGLSSDPGPAAKQLYALLRLLDQEGIEEAWVDVNFPHTGLWLTLKERLEKAASQ